MAFWDFKKPEKDVNITRMLGICETEAKGDMMPEVLSLLADSYGEGSILSIVRVWDRTVISSSEGKPGAALNALAGTLDYVDKHVWHSRSEKTSVAFRTGINYVTVRPLRCAGEVSYAAVLETRDKPQEPRGRQYTLLSLLVELSVLRGDTPHYMLPGIEWLEAELKNAKESCVVIFGTRKGMMLNFEKKEMIAAKVGAVLSQEKEVYRLGECRFGMIVPGDSFGAVRMAGLMMDQCFEEGIDFISAGVAPVLNDPDVSVMMAKKAMLDAKAGEVRIAENSAGYSKKESSAGFCEWDIDGTDGIRPADRILHSMHIKTGGEGVGESTS